MTNKICTKCEEGKDIVEFGNNKKNKDGLKSWCRTCGNESSRIYRANNKDKVRAADVKRNQTAARKASHNVHAATYRKKFPKVTAAHMTIRNAIKNKTMINPGCCSKCDSTANIQFHHPDYLKPTFGVWVCPPCHSLEPEAINRA